MVLTGKKIVIIIENLPLPFDRRVWQESRALKESGADVYIICPVGKGYDSYYEKIDDIYIYIVILYRSKQMVLLAISLNMHVHYFIKDDC